ncbi:MAG: hypothetical protein H6765_05055 [Candidatus Peribacteria bacterium]|nr:MAG: hypothetical protein H6765_05055 [Candidatus Peribacteria bacterium]
MNRDATVIQAAILLIIIAILGVAIVKKQNASHLPTNEAPIVSIQTPTTSTVIETTPTPPTITGTGSITISGAAQATEKPLTEQLNSNKANLVRAYFKALGEQDFTKACDMMSPAKCSSVRPAAVASFSREYEKLINGYEYLSVKDLNITAPSGKDIVCVKYAYRYIDDLNPQPISEILSFYVDEVDGELKITDRVCEKKYKEGSGVRPCPIEASQNFCVGLIK